MVRIAVTGHAERALPAERGTLRVEVSAVGDDRREVLERVTRTHTDLRAEAQAHVDSGAATWWGSHGVSSGQLIDWEQRDGQQVKVRRFQARADVRVRFSDFTALAEWSVAVAEREDVEVAGITWDLTDSRRDSVIDDVRVDATRDALAKAFVFARAAGLGSPRLVALYEEGLRPGGDRPPVQPVMRSMAMDSGGRGGGVELRPDDIELTVSVSADFEADGA
ncbi:MAG TPA: hypothetical protein DHV14_06665 [Micrococcales bacterium]|uniref:SIMPL domain-containing protein n=1 Tax=Miniimonas arenae TaxID=676201 RepID=UPI000EEE7DFB|nr:SIMPL domain-containing protein [Miniimonas arenae]HCX84805.1 hypothetical protein [Micrococcales bacterium]